MLGDKAVEEGLKRIMGLIQAVVGSRSERIDIGRRMRHVVVVLPTLDIYL